MSRLCLLFSFMVLSAFAFSQNIDSGSGPDKLFYGGKALYYDGNYPGCLDKMREYRKNADKSNFIPETDFFIAASAYYSGEKDALDLLNAYLDSYPETNHRDEVSFMIGSLYFSAGKFDLASFWLGKVDPDNLSPGNQEDYAYRMAYSCMYVKKKKNESYRLFGLLMQNSKKYRNASIYYSAYLYYSDGDYVNALNYFEKIRDLKDFNPDVLYYITQIYFIKKDYVRTIREGSYLLQQYGGGGKYNVEICRLVGASCFYMKDYDNSIKYLNRYVQESNSPDPDNLYMLGWSYYNEKEYRYAVYYFKKSNPSENALGQNTNLYLGQSYLKMGDERNAILAFETASRMNFDPVAKELAAYNYAMLLHKNSIAGFGESVSVLENFLNTYPNSIYADNVNRCLADVYLSSKNYDAALESIARIKAPSQRILEAEQKIYYYKGIVGFTNADYRNAVQCFDKAIERGDYAKREKSESFYWRGESYYRLSMYREAVEDYKTFLNSSHAGDEKLEKLSLYNLGYCYFKEKQYDQAKYYFTSFTARETENGPMLADAYSRLGDCLFYNRQFTDAESAYSRAADVLPSGGDYALFQKGSLLGLQKDYRGKIAQMDRLIDKYPDSRYIPDAMYEEGRAYVMLDENESAVNIYRRLIAKFPDNENSRKAAVQIAQLYYGDNNLQKAISSYKEVIRNYPGSDEAKVAVQDLKSVYMENNDISGYAAYMKNLGESYRLDAGEQDSLTYLSAEKYFMKNDFEGAKSNLKKYLQQYPNGNFAPNAHYYLGKIYDNEKNYALAKKEFEASLSQRGNKYTEETLSSLADMQYNDKEYEKAFSSYSQLKDMTSDGDRSMHSMVGMMRSEYKLGKFGRVIDISGAIMKNPSVDPEIATESRYYRALSYLDTDETEKAIEDLKDLSRDTRTAYGAQSKYLLAQKYFDTGQISKAETEVSDYIKRGTPYPYWLAKTYILMSDICLKKKDVISARQYLESLRHNYKNTNDDIHSIIEERLSKL